MNALQEKLFLELRQTKMEIMNSLKKKQKDDWLTRILQEELKDIDSALIKMEQGNYGLCEMSREFLPVDILEMVPTIKSVQDSKNMEIYRKKPFY
jgi:RNA polymerase-binding transcription factor DksA